MLNGFHRLVLVLPLLALGGSCSSTSSQKPVLVATNDRVVLRKKPPGTYPVHALIVHQVELALDHPWPAAANPAALQSVREAFSAAVRADLAPAYELTDTPGPGVLIVETRLTDRIRDPELLAELPKGAEETAQRAFLELRLTESDTGDVAVAAIWAPKAIAWEGLLNMRVTQEAKVNALRTFTGALRSGLDLNRNAIVR
jgi:hypothetical protein